MSYFGGGGREGGGVIRSMILYVSLKGNVALQSDLISIPPCIIRDSEATAASNPKKMNVLPLFADLDPDKL